ncbi:mechanosensitive ion channel family protein [Psychrobacter sanguinis]|uniref:mechanosensitive ion channel family protein n=1 Tax=Psychrobacter sanguinis TaxID=861445 RepID=UPI00020C79DD|nr:mechanosensitive ion channel family protein [Psychrobacter sanguinis]EGK14308.1 small-conductance mechanosensitive ion channel MscS [Psychrobacter sp. 1501(2011)]MCD9150707.1 mechanosensitive ion channel family protein [Psychrobacter sanguinis]
MPQVTVTDKVGDKINEYQVIASAANDMVNDFIVRLPYFMVAVVVLLVFWLLSLIFKSVVSKLLSKSHTHRNLVRVFQRIGGALIFFIGLMIAMVIAIPGFTPAKLVGALGIGSVAIGFAFKDIFQNLLSGILLLLSEPFRIGDQIVSGEFEGTVEDIKVRATTIRTYDGRQVVIPNSQLYTSALTVNTAYKRRRLELTVGIGYEDDIRKAKEVILQALEKAETVSKLAEPSVVATEFGASSIDLKVRWFINDGTQANKVASIHEVIIEIKDQLDAAGVNIPFPIRTLDFSDESAGDLVKKMARLQSEKPE